MKELSKGIMISEVGFANISLILKNAGFNFLIIDCEHGGFDYKEVSSLIMIANLCNIEPYVRLSNNERKDIIKYCDMGAKGLILPMTNTKNDIEKVVQFAKYSPIGKRGLSTTRAHTFYSLINIDEYKKVANNMVKVFAQIETTEGLSNIDDIMSCKGVYGAFIGPIDLSDELECLSDKNSQMIKDAIRIISESADKFDKVSGIISTNINYLETAKHEGMTYFSVGSELSILIDGCNEISKKIESI